MSQEIRERIDFLHQELEKRIIPGIFTLNPEVGKITSEIFSLQEKCNHHFINGQCEYCCKEEG
jgi:hypothetical protein